MDWMTVPTPVECENQLCVSQGKHISPCLYEYKWFNWVINNKCFLEQCCNCCECLYCKDKDKVHPPGCDCTGTGCKYDPELIMDLFEILFTYFQTLFNYLNEANDYLLAILIAIRTLDFSNIPSPDYMPILQDILQAIKDLEISVKKTINEDSGDGEQDKSKPWWQRLWDMFLKIIEWVIELLMKLVELIIDIIKGLWEMFIQPIFGWTARSLTEFLSLFGIGGELTEWHTSGSELFE